MPPKEWTIDNSGSQARLLRGSKLIGIIYDDEYADIIASILTAGEKLDRSFIMHGDDL